MRDRPVEYNWQPTLWHELAHVVTLQLSNNRVPRWVTEGISVWEERRARPEWGREMDVAFAHAMDKNKVMKLADLNEGFSEPGVDFPRVSRGVARGRAPGRHLR